MKDLRQMQGINVILTLNFHNRFNLKVVVGFFTIELTDCKLFVLIISVSLYDTSKSDRRQTYKQNYYYNHFFLNFMLSIFLVSLTLAIALMYSSGIRLEKSIQYFPSYLYAFTNFTSTFPLTTPDTTT